SLHAYRHPLSALTSFFLMLPPPPRPTLFPYTTLFRSLAGTGIRTADNIDSLEILTYDGIRMRVGKTSETELEQIIRSGGRRGERSEEHTSELQSLAYLVCRLLLEKKNMQTRHS